MSNLFCFIPLHLDDGGLQLRKSKDAGFQNIRILHGTNEKGLLTQKCQHSENQVYVCAQNLIGASVVLSTMCINVLLITSGFGTVGKWRVLLTDRNKACFKFSRCFCTKSRGGGAGGLIRWRCCAEDGHRLFLISNITELKLTTTCFFLIHEIVSYLEKNLIASSYGFCCDRKYLIPKDLLTFLWWYRMVRYIVRSPLLARFQTARLSSTFPAQVWWNVIHNVLGSGFLARPQRHFHTKIATAVERHRLMTRHLKPSLTAETWSNSASVPLHSSHRCDFRVFSGLCELNTENLQSLIYSNNGVLIFTSFKPQQLRLKQQKRRAWSRNWLFRRIREISISAVAAVLSELPATVLH